MLKHILLIATVYATAFNIFHCSSASTVLEWISGNSTLVSDLEPAGDEPRLTHPSAIMHVCRARVTVNDSNGATTAVVPGKYFSTGRSAGTAYIAFGGKLFTLTKSQVEFLSYPPGVVSWVPKEGILATTKFVIGGFDPLTVQPLYICRGRVDPNGERYTSLILGRYENGICTIELQGLIEMRTRFEVLSVNALGQLHNVGDGAKH